MKIPQEVYSIAEDIKTMRIRGASRIARAAANALKIAAQQFKEGNRNDFYKYIIRVSEILRNTRPTAVSLPNAISYVLSRFKREYDRGSDLEELKNVIITAADNFIKYSKNATKKIGEIGARRIVNGDTILTHCNSAAALSVIITAFKEGKDIKVFATETRPRYQGYITVRVLSREGIDVTLIPDSAVRFIMKKIDKVIVGADAVAANGAVVNKIGTSLIALAAHEARVNFFVAAETYKFSPMTVIGEVIEIEERSPLEVVSEDFLKSVKHVIIRNPAFDVTPPEYIDAIITEKGLIPPQAAIIVLKEEYGYALEDLMTKAIARVEESEEFLI